ncbi:hypothetical protein LNK15_00375 [Jeotgalicoccus huakuii]|uniref:hypothetical protein n=1 Tax=Jeotgalicoccus sp. S0W5 TaxID=2527874 RepID=UPI0014152E2F|nr:hypothetical protein [Jeotgalicoccus sp. S0W5]MCK1975508.1 hypothetical protein [Jeotgalicoccus huakuii]
MIKYEELSKELLVENNGQGMEIVHNEESFFFLVNIVEGSDKLIALSGGALDQKKKSPPVYMRSKWKDEIKYNSIYIDDRTIHGNNLKIGWGVGNRDRHFLKDYVVIIKKIADILGIKANNTMYYGSSMGGLMSVIMATMHKDSFAVIDNPQTNIFNYYQSYVDSLREKALDGMTVEEINRDFPERVSMIDAMLKYDNVPRIYYYQNNKCSFDMKYHYGPFKKQFEENGFDDGKVSYRLYSDAARGHSPQVKVKTLKIFDEIFSGI